LGRDTGRFTKSGEVLDELFFGFLVVYGSKRDKAVGASIIRPPVDAATARAV
jgi:hypothetical protein